MTMVKTLITIVTAAVLCSCMSFSDRPVRPMRNAILAQNPELTLEKEVAINVGRSLFSLLDAFAVGDSDLSNLDNVNVAVYKVRGHRGGEQDLGKQSFEQALLETDRSLHWEQIVRVRDAGENVWVFAGMDLRRNRLDAISVIVLEQDELVLINVDGDIDEMMRYALESSRGRRGEHTAG